MMYQFSLNDGRKKRMRPKSLYPMGKGEIHDEQQYIKSGIRPEVTTPPGYSNDITQYRTTLDSLEMLDMIGTK